jgi:dienelactone hydrolase
VAKILASLVALLYSPLRIFEAALLNRLFVIVAIAALACLARDGRADDIPRTVEEVAKSFDPRRDELDVRLVRQWERDGLVFRYVTFHIGEFKGKPARMAAFFAFPQGVKKAPGLLHIHGGGQRAFLHEVDYYARRGYACLSINWGGREMEEAREGDPNTDWGAVDPTQTNVPGYLNMRPGERYLDPIDSPRNNNWYLLTLGARRGLTFLERQREVDAERLGVYGHSMGGNLTIYVAGADSRIKVAAPSVGGSGFRTLPWALFPDQKKQLPNGDVALFDATLGFESYAPRIQAPTLWLSSTNDFHGIMDDLYLTSELIPHQQQVRYSITPHMNHRFTPAFEVARPLWLDQHLRGSFSFPKTPATELQLADGEGPPVLRVKPDPSLPISRVQIMYSVDPHPQARFWRTADSIREGDSWLARLPLLDTTQPLFAFANVHYRLPRAEPLQFARPTDELALSSLLHTATPDDLQRSGAKASDKPSLLIEDFQHDWRDWYRLSADNPHHWEYSTRKLNDPKWRGQPGWKLALTVQAQQANELVIVLTENFFRSYRGKSREWTAVVKLSGGNKAETFRLTPADFRASTGDTLGSWEQLDLLSFRAYFEQDGKLLGSKQWSGAQPVFRELRWVDAKLAGGN